MGRGGVIAPALFAFECSACSKLALAPERDEATCSAFVGVLERGTGCSNGLRGDTGFESAGAESILGVVGAASMPVPAPAPAPVPVLSVDDMATSGATGGVTSLPDPTEPLMLVLLQVVLESEGGMDKSGGAFGEVECDADATASGIRLLDKNNPCMCVTVLFCAR